VHDQDAAGHDSSGQAPYAIVAMST